MKIAASQTQVCKLKLGTGKAHASMFVVTLQNIFLQKYLCLLTQIQKCEQLSKLALCKLLAKTYCIAFDAQPFLYACVCLIADETNLPADIPSYLSSQGTLAERQEGYGSSENGSQHHFMSSSSMGGYFLQQRDSNGKHLNLSVQYLTTGMQWHC